MSDAAQGSVSVQQAPQAYYSGADYAGKSEDALVKELEDIKAASQDKQDKWGTLKDNFSYLSDERNLKIASEGLGGAAGAYAGWRMGAPITLPGESLQEAGIRDPGLKAKLPEYYGSQTITEGTHSPRFSIFHKTYYNPHSLDKGVLQEPTERFGAMINDLEPKNQHIDPRTGKVSYIETPFEIAKREREVARLRNQMVPGVRELTAQPWAPYNNTRYTNPNTWGTQVPPSYERWETNTRSQKAYGADIPPETMSPAGGAPRGFADAPDPNLSRGEPTPLRPDPGPRVSDVNDYKETSRPTPSASREVGPAMRDYTPPPALDRPRGKEVGPYTPGENWRYGRPDKPIAWHPLDIYRQPGKVEETILKAIDKVAPEGSKRDYLLKMFTQYGNKILEIPGVAKALNIAGGAATGYAGLQTLNRLHQGDYSGAAWSGLEALGGGLTLLPHPLTKGAGLGIGAIGALGNTFLHDDKQ